MNIREWDKKISKKEKNRKSFGPVFVVYILLAFIILFTYSSLNLKNIDYGYKMQELISKTKVLNEEIDKLKAVRANLLNLDRVEKIVTQKLRYQHPKPEQFIKVFEE